ncbi:MAG: transposase [Acidobacteriia bacterium]|nr:transposase [Terriglobia bacterium]
MSRQRHYYGLNHLHYLTASTYRRVRLFASARFRQHFIQTLQQLRSGLDFKILGYVLMPEHFHLLVWPCGPSNPSQIALIAHIGKSAMYAPPALAEMLEQARAVPAPEREPEVVSGE